MAKHASTPLLVSMALLAGVTLGAIAVQGLRGDEPQAVPPGQDTHVMGAAPASTAFVQAHSGNCDMAPLLPAVDRRDGRYSLQQKPDAAEPREVSRLILRGKEAEAGRRQHDAEVSFLNACRKAAVLDEPNPVPLADAMYQLGRLYANAAALGAPQAKTLFERSERLYSASLEAYRARYGEQAEKTRYARQGLQTVQLATGGKAPVNMAQAAPAAAAPGAADSQAAAAAPVEAPVLTAAAAPAQAEVPTPAPAPAKEAWPPQPRSTIPRDAAAVRAAGPSTARVERPDTTTAGAGPAPKPRHHRPRVAHQRHQIALPPATGTGNAGAEGGDRWQR